MSQNFCMPVSIPTNSQSFPDLQCSPQTEAGVLQERYPSPQNFPLSPNTSTSKSQNYSQQITNQHKNLKVLIPQQKKELKDINILNVGNEYIAVENFTGPQDDFRDISESINQWNQKESIYSPKVKIEPLSPRLNNSTFNEILKPPSLNQCTSERENYHDESLPQHIQLDTQNPTESLIPPEIHINQVQSIYEGSPLQKRLKVGDDWNS